LNKLAEQDTAGLEHVVSLIESALNNNLKDKDVLEEDLVMVKLSEQGE